MSLFFGDLHFSCAFLQNFTSVNFLSIYAKIQYNILALVFILLTPREVKLPILIRTNYCMDWGRNYL